MRMLATALTLTLIAAPAIVSARAGDAPPPRSAPAPRSAPPPRSAPVQRSAPAQRSTPTERQAPPTRGFNLRPDVPTQNRPAPVSPAIGVNRNRNFPDQNRGFTNQRGGVNLQQGNAGFVRGGRRYIGNPVFRGPAWGWNRGNVWAPNGGYWGGGFWGGFAIGSGLFFGSLVDNGVTYNSYQINDDSPGATLLENYHLQQTQCGPPDLVVIYGPDNSVICAYPNDIVDAGEYTLDPSTLTIVSM